MMSTNNGRRNVRIYHTDSDVVVTDDKNAVFDGGYRHGKFLIYRLDEGMNRHYETGAYSVGTKVMISPKPGICLGAVHKSGVVRKVDFAPWEAFVNAYRQFTSQEEAADEKVRQIRAERDAAISRLNEDADKAIKEARVYESLASILMKLNGDGE